MSALLRNFPFRIHNVVRCYRVAPQLRTLGSAPPPPSGVGHYLSTDCKGGDTPPPKFPTSSCNTNSKKETVCKVSCSSGGGEPKKPSTKESKCGAAREPSEPSKKPKCADRKVSPCKSKKKEPRCPDKGCLKTSTVGGKFKAIKIDPKCRKMKFYCPDKACARPKNPKPCDDPCKNKDSVTTAQRNVVPIVDGNKGDCTAGSSTPSPPPTSSIPNSPASACKPCASKTQATASAATGPYNDRSQGTDGRRQAEQVRTDGRRGGVGAAQPLASDIARPRTPGSTIQPEEASRRRQPSPDLSRPLPTPYTNADDQGLLVGAKQLIHSICSLFISAKKQKLQTKRGGAEVGMLPPGPNSGECNSASRLPTSATVHAKRAATAATVTPTPPPLSKQSAPITQAAAPKQESPKPPKPTPYASIVDRQPTRSKSAEPSKTPTSEPDSPKQVKSTPAVRDQNLEVYKGPDPASDCSPCKKKSPCASRKKKDECDPCKPKKPKRKSCKRLSSSSSSCKKSSAKSACKQEEAESSCENEKSKSACQPVESSPCSKESPCDKMVAAVEAAGSCGKKDPCKKDPPCPPPPCPPKPCPPPPCPKPCPPPPCPKPCPPPPCPKPCPPPPCPKPCPPPPCPKPCPPPPKKKCEASPPPEEKCGDNNPCARDDDPCKGSCEKPCKKKDVCNQCPECPAPPKPDPSCPSPCGGGSSAANGGASGCSKKLSPPSMAPPPPPTSISCDQDIGWPYRETRLVLVTRDLVKETALQTKQCATSP